MQRSIYYIIISFSFSSFHFLLFIFLLLLLLFLFFFFLYFLFFFFLFFLFFFLLLLYRRSSPQALRCIALLAQSVEPLNKKSLQDLRHNQTLEAFQKLQNTLYEAIKSMLDPVYMIIISCTFPFLFFYYYYFFFYILFIFIDV